jgi:hypothetical protein
MGLTHFPHGLSTFGIPIYGSSGFPFDAPGSHYFVDAVNGSDSNDGTEWSRAKATVSAGYALCATNKNDVLHILGGATAYSNTAVLTFDKDYTHVVAHAAPVYTGGRVRLTNTVTTATAGEFVISGTGGVYVGLHWQFGGSATATSLVGVALSGNGRNAFINCNFEGPIDAGIGAAVAQRMLTITSSQDNLFYGCAFGQRSILNTSATGAIVSFNGTNCSNNVFEKCVFNAYNSNTASATINYVNNAMPDSGWTLFRDCSFFNHYAANIADPIRFTTGAHGIVMLDRCGLGGLGTLVWATNNKTTIFNTVAAGAATGGVGANPA